MASIQVKYRCGCGYSTNSQDEAVEHSDHNKHTIPVLGYIMPENSREEKRITLVVEEDNEKA